MQPILNKIFEIAILIDKLIKNESTEKLKNLKNSSGDEQTKLDILSDKIIENELKNISEIKSIVSEEKGEIININNSGKYLVAYDPLDGSSLIESNLSIGSIFGIYENDFKGKDIIAASYILYGPRLEVLFASKNSVNLFRFVNGKFEEIHLNNLSEKGKIISPGGKNTSWSENHRNMINYFWLEGYKLRYSGCMVADLHQIILKGGGLFSYPEIGDTGLGKLRRLFEVFPFAFIFEKLYGEAIDGKGKRILDNGYNDIHDNIPCYFGSKTEIEIAMKYLK